MADATVSARRASALLLVAVVVVLVTSIPLVAASGVWNQVHHDARNTGRAAFDTTQGVNAGPCPKWNILANQSDPTGPEVIQADGVLNLDGSVFYYVGESPLHHVVHKVDAVTGESIGTWHNEFINFNQRSVGGVAVGVNAALSSEILYAAFDNHVHFIQPDTMESIWDWEGPNPVLAPIHLTDQGGVVLVTTSNATHDSNGILHALNAHTGKEVWVFEATEGPLNNPVSWGLRITPAVTSMGVVIVAFGQTIVALDIQTGKELSRDNTLPFLAIMGSSPVVASDDKTIFVRSKADGGDLWKFQLNSTTAPLEIKRQWACGYQTLAPVCGQFTANTDQDFSDFPDKFKKQMSSQPAEAGLQLTPGDDNVGTPALAPNDAAVIFGLYATEANKGGVHSASTTDGSRNWRYLSTQDSSDLGDMMSRSSPALDSQGNVFIGMDQVNPGQAGIPPVLLALDAQGNRMWVDPGTQSGPLFNPIGLRSPLLGYSPTEGVAAAKVIFARQENVASFGPGQICPSSTPLFGCSGHGSCDCQTGFCDCNVLECFAGDDCGVTQDCNGHGQCTDGLCYCTTPCFAGPECGVANTCSNRGSCSLAANGCTCSDPCYFGDDCQYEKDCNGNGQCDSINGQCDCNPNFSGTDCEDYTTPSSGMGAGGVFAIILVILVLAGAGFVVYRKKVTGRWLWDGIGKGSAPGEWQPLSAKGSMNASL